MEGKNKHKKSEKITFQCNETISWIRYNINRFLAENNMTQKRLNDLTGLPTSTFNNLLYGNLTDCKLSTAITIARTLGISLNELTNAGTIEEVVQKHMIAIRSLPDHAKYHCRWNIEYYVELYKEQDKMENKIISVINPLLTNDCMMKISNFYSECDISGIDADIKDKVFCGLKIRNDLYMPYYSPYDTLLIAYDRCSKPNEHVVFVKNDNIFIAKYLYHKFYNIFNGEYWCSDEDITKILGYVTYVIHGAKE